MITAEQITELAQNLPEYDYDYVGIRVQYETYDAAVGERYAYQSRVWVDGEETEDTLGGVSAVDAEMARDQVLEFGAYDGSVVLILGCTYASTGDDDGERIMRDPMVLGILTF